ncbi:TPA: hypothetical protein P2R00_002469 [Aeromonas veronii]|nr:hypothetical protein [Aeromonas veronii]
MFLDDDFVQFVVDNPVLGVSKVCSKLEEFLSVTSHLHAWTEQEHEVMWEVATFINIILIDNGLDDELVLPEVTGSISNNCSSLRDYVSSVKQNITSHAIQLQVNSYTERYRHLAKRAFAYEFSQGDLDRVQLLINELRTQITENQSLESNHRQRILKRLEHLQSELHKRVSDLDRFWGLVGDAGVVLGKLGTDAKPIVDRIKEIAEIAWKTQARAEELPSSSPNPMLGQSE